MAKINFYQLAAHLKKSFAPLYLISGDDPLLKQDTLQLMRDAATVANITEKQRFYPENQQDWEHILSLLNSVSLFADKQLIEIHLNDHTPNKAVAALIEEYARSPAQDKVVVMITNKLEAKVTKSAWYQACDKHGITLALWPMTTEQLPQWLITRAKNANCALTLNAAKLLADYVEGNLVAASQMIEKISLLAPQKTVDETIIEALLTDENRYTIFDLVDHVIAGHPAKALHVLQHLKDDGAEPVLVLWGLTRELRTLAQLAQEKQRGPNLDTLFQQQRVFPRRQPLIRRFLSTHSIQTCYDALKHALDIDRIIKGAVPGNPWDSLALLCLRMQ